MRLFLLPLLLAACAAPPAPQKPASTMGQILARNACPYRIVEADAWINMMPGPTQAPRDLHVFLRLDSPTDTAMLLKADRAAPGELALEIRQTTDAPIPGQLAWREPATDPLPKRISILCRGGEIAAATEIRRVY